MGAVDVPADFAADLINLAGEAGRAWIDTVPLLVHDLCRAWDLAVDGATMHGYLGLVVPVVRGAARCMLKVSWPDESTVQEMNALRAWAGRGMVRLLEADENHVALL